MKDQQPRHVFISYVRENQEQVDRLCHELERHGVKVWLDRKSIKPGARWKDAIREAIRHGDFFIACFSKEHASRQKNFMNEELTLAIDELRQFALDREWFIPVLLSECDVPARSIGAGETLLDINWVPLYEDWETGIQRILSVIKPIPPEIQNLINAVHSVDKDVRDRAVRALGEFGDPASVPALIETLKDEDDDIRWRVAEALGKIGAEAKLAVPVLIEALKKDDFSVVRMMAAEALRNIDPEDKVALSAIIEGLNQDKNARAGFAEILGKFGPKAKVAVPNLIEVLKDKDVLVRRQAAEALGKIGAEAKAAVPVLIEAFKDENNKARWYTAQALGNIGPEANEAVPALFEELKSGHRADVAEALEKINTSDALKALEEYKQKSK